MIAIVVPTIRPEKYKHFLKVWSQLFKKHTVMVVGVEDGENPKIIDAGFTPEDVMGKFADLVYNKNDGVRNLGFAFIARFHKHIDVIISFDDDVEPYGDTIQDHLDALSQKVPVSWISTASQYMRGFPYNVRTESEAVMSHGVWEGVKDWDAPTQLTLGNRDVSFYKGPVPKGIFYPHCAMNFAFKRKALPLVYQAPMGYRVGLDRFADIWMGIECKKDLDKKNWAVVTGYAKVYHKRASNVFTNLVKESKGLGMNEEYGKDPYFKLFYSQRRRWKEYVNSV